MRFCAESSPTREVSNRDHCLALLRELEDGIIQGFHQTRDLNILRKLYGTHATKQEKDNLFKRYQTWFFDGALPGRGAAGKWICYTREMSGPLSQRVRLEIDRLERQRSSEAEWFALEGLVQNVPDDPKLHWPRA